MRRGGRIASCRYNDRGRSDKPPSTVVINWETVLDVFNKFSGG